MNQNTESTIQETPKASRAPKKIDPEVYLILGWSDMGNKFAPSAHPKFTSIKDAEVFGLDRIKTIRWRVAKEVVRKNENGKEEVQYDFVSGVFNSRGFNEGE